MFGGNEGMSEMNITHIVIIILLIYIIWRLHNTGEKLRQGAYFGNGLDKYLYTSGATMRRLGQVFSQPGQGIQTTVYNAERRYDPGQKTAQGIPVVMYLDNGMPFSNQTNLYTAINNPGPATTSEQKYMEEQTK